MPTRAPKRKPDCVKTPYAFSLSRMIFLQYGGGLLEELHCDDPRELLTLSI
jgi:hypothetical protein